MSNQKPKILLLGRINLAHEAWSTIPAVATVLTPQSTDRDSFLKECSDGAFDGVVAIYRTFKSVSITGILDGQLVSALPPSVRFICHNGAGYDHINVPACSARSPPILVSNTPTAVNDATADLAVFLILGALRGFNKGIFDLRRGNWLKNCSLGRDPQGLVLGILGMGGIGGALKRRTDRFGFAETIYCNRRRLELEMEDGARFVGFEELLESSDVLVIGLPLNDETHHIISAREFSLMKRGIVIVNIARGAVMDENALVHALDQGIVSSVGLDVYEHEPQVHPGLLANENVLLVPHMGTFTSQTLKKMEEWCVENLRMSVVEGKLKSVVPEQKGMI